LKKALIVTLIFALLGLIGNRQHADQDDLKSFDTLERRQQIVARWGK
jgi:hypothetical protein